MSPRRPQPVTVDDFWHALYLENLRNRRDAERRRMLQAAAERILRLFGIRRPGKR